MNWGGKVMTKIRILKNKQRNANTRSFTIYEVDKVRKAIVDLKMINIGKK